jgi:hypothetical protein
LLFVVLCVLHAVSVLGNTLTLLGLGEVGLRGGELKYQYYYYYFYFYFYFFFSRNMSLRQAWSERESGNGRCEPT